MRFKLNATVCLLLAGVLAFCTWMVLGGSAEMSVEVKLIWGTNESKSPNPNHKPVAPELAAKLKNSPFKWENYFEVTNRSVTLPLNKEQTVPISKTCEVRIKNLGKSEVELRLFGKGKQVSKTTQAVPKGELLVTGGNAENATAWFVVLRRVE